MLALSSRIQPPSSSNRYPEQRVLSAAVPTRRSDYPALKQGAVTLSSITMLLFPGVVLGFDAPVLALSIVALALISSACCSLILFRCLPTHVASSLLPVVWVGVAIRASVVALQFAFLLSRTGRISTALVKDQALYHFLASQLAEGLASPTSLPINNAGFPLALAMIYRVFGPLPELGFFFVFLSGTLAFAITIAVCYRMTRDRAAASVAGLFVATSGLLISNDTQLLKDSIILLLVAGVIAAMRFDLPRIQPSKSLVILLFSMMLAPLRPAAAILALATLGLRFGFGKEGLVIRAGWAIVLVLIAVLALQSATSLSPSPTFSPTEYANFSTESRWRHTSDQHGVMASYMTGYSSSYATRVVRLPLSAAFGYLQPFSFFRPQAWDSPADGAASLFHTFWIFFFGPVWIWSVYVAARSPNRGWVERLTLAGLVFFLAIVSTTGGAVPRYLAQLAPYLAIGIAGAVSSARRTKHATLRLRRFYLLYAGLLASGLAYYTLRF